jgi:hypothetical protein
MSDRVYNCCPTHCCIEHGCKYGYEGCPVANGIVKQAYPCESCGLETEGYYGEPERTIEEQEEYLNALWEEKHNPRQLSPQEQEVADFAKKYGRSKVLNILKNLPADVKTVIEVLETLKGIK